ncbi:hypothetical protein Esti_005845 [Eimeria stiedai]
MPEGGPQRGPSGGGPPRRSKGGRIQCTVEGPRESASVAGESEPFDFESFKEGLDLKVLESSEERVVLQLRGCDASLANALRRILISEVPTVALETIQACLSPIAYHLALLQGHLLLHACFSRTRPRVVSWFVMWQNTGVVQDEVLAHRLGLIPFRVNPEKLKYRTATQELGEENALKLKLHVKCTAANLQPYQKSMPVYARDLKWIPMSDRQKAKFAEDPPLPVHPDILITKLRPGQEIELVGFLEKGLGKMHAKWSPVATAVYRLEPEFVFLKPIEGKEAEELKSLCPMGVFEIEDTGGAAYAKYPRRCTTCRACLERFEGSLQLTKIPDQFIFSIESTCCVPAPKLFKMALGVLREKTVTFREIIRTKRLD